MGNLLFSCWPIHKELKKKNALAQCALLKLDGEYKCGHMNFESSSISWSLVANSRINKLINRKYTGDWSKTHKNLIHRGL